MTPHACRYQEEAAQRKLRLFKRGESGFSKTVKYHGIRNTAVSETYPNTTKFLILWYFIKTIVFLENYKKYFVSKQGVSLLVRAFPLCLRNLIIHIDLLLGSDVVI
jgi:hypothetical protein